MSESLEPRAEPDRLDEQLHDLLDGPTPEATRIAAMRAQLANVRALAIHGQNGDHRALAAALIALVDLLDGQFES